jgi:hypothetical protein
MKRQQMGILNPNWRGGKHYNNYGYVLIRFNNRYVLEHRLIMEKAIGRSLTRHEAVHHINGIKTDNRIENLQLMSHRSHQNLHHIVDMSDRICSKCKSKFSLNWFKNKDKTGYICQKCRRRQYYLEHNA